VAVIPQNASALSFWKKTIHDYAHGHFTHETKTVLYDEYQPHRIIFTFETLALN